MEPLKPQDRQKALDAGATREELAEYDRLIAQRFTTNPYLAKSPEATQEAKAREMRIGDLYQKLFSVVRPG